MTRPLDPLPYVDLFTGERYTFQQGEEDYEVPFLPRDEYEGDYDRYKEETA